LAPGTAPVHVYPTVGSGQRIKRSILRRCHLADGLLFADTLLPACRDPIEGSLRETVKVLSRRVGIAQKFPRMIVNSAVFPIEPCKASAPGPDPKATMSSTVFNAKGA
jgi:hypothetical protein